MWEMKAKGVPLTTPVYSAVLNAYRRIDHWQAAVAAVHEIHDWPVKPNVFNYNLAICTCADCGQWEEALDLLHYMRDVGGVEPDVVTYNIVIAACGKAGEAAKAIEIFREMSEVSCVARVVHVCLYVGRGGFRVGLLVDWLLAEKRYFFCFVCFDGFGFCRCSGGSAAKKASGVFDSIRSRWWCVGCLLSCCEPVQRFFLRITLPI